MKVLVLMGGVSLERDVSLASGEAVVGALKELGHEVRAIDTALGDTSAGKLTADKIKALPPDPVELARYDRETSVKLVTPVEASRVDVVFLALHGGAGEDGTLQALLELAGKRFTGSGVLASALAMNKATSKKLFERDGIPTPDWRLIHRRDYNAEALRSLASEFPPPVIVKPNDQGSTVGLTLVETDEAYASAVENVFAVSKELLVEKYIVGRELTVAVLGDTPLPVVEIFPKNKLYDYECKYTEGMCTYQCPARITAAETAEIQRSGLMAFRALGCRGYARVDFRLDASGRFYCLEVNTLPGMTKTSLVPKAAKAAGLTFEQLVQRIIELAVEV